MIRMRLIGKFCLVCLLLLPCLAGAAERPAKEYLPAAGAKPLIIVTEEPRLSAAPPSLEEWEAVVAPDPVEEKSPEAEPSEAGEKPAAEPRQEEAHSEGTDEETCPSEATAPPSRAEEEGEAENKESSTMRSSGPSPSWEARYLDPRWEDEVIRFYLGVERPRGDEGEIRVLLPLQFEPPRPQDVSRGRATYRRVD